MRSGGMYSFILINLIMFGNLHKLDFYAQVTTESLKSFFSLIQNILATDFLWGGR